MFLFLFLHCVKKWVTPASSVFKHMSNMQVAVKFHFFALEEHLLQQIINKLSLYRHPKTDKGIRG